MKILGLILIVVGILNFVSFCIIAEKIGGSAGKRTADSGNYYLSNHGTRTEVSEALWRYSKYHSISVFITHPLAMFGIVL